MDYKYLARKILRILFNRLILCLFLAVWLITTIICFAKELPPTDPADIINISILDDSLLGPIAQIKSALLFNTQNAGALELDGGSRVFRANATYGFVLDDNNRLKLTTEYLRENLDFNFYTGDTRQWVQQGAIGAAYQYLLQNNTFKSLQLGSHYSHAPSKDLSTVTISNSDSTLTDYRRIAGGNDLNGTAETGLQLWHNSLLTVGTDYDRVRYNIKYTAQSGQDAQGFGGHFRLEQSLKNNFGLQVQSTISQLFNTYGLNLNWTWHSTPTNNLSTGISSSYTQDHTTARNFWVNALNVNMIWDTVKTPISSSSTDKFSTDSTQSLNSWTQIPAVRMPDVLAISDERITTTTHSAPFVPVSGVCPISPQYNSATGQYSASGGWYQSYIQGPISTNPLIAFDSASIMGNPSGAMDCLYRIYDLNGFSPPIDVILINDTYTNVIGTGNFWSSGYSQNWPNIGTYPSSFCFSGNPDYCTFQTAPPS